ncbi:MAG: DUF6279 family lipoprotein [Cellvibrionaceae bacterium]|nr:DUF6279 family lipoprotein [Cellvibrionaceae bacterium]
MATHKAKKTLGRTGLILILLLTLAACTTKVAYNFLDWAIEWKVQRMVKLHGEQKILTQKAIKDFHHWHRTTQLPLYADYLRLLQIRLNDTPITGEEIHAETDKVQVLVDQSVEKVLPDATEVLSTLSDAQVKELLKSVAEERKEYKEEYVDPSEKKRQRIYYKKFIKHAQDWLGTLSKAQKEQVKTWSEQLEPFETLNLEQQKIWEQDLEKILAQRQDKTALLKDLQNLMFHRTDNWQPELEKILDRNQALSYELIANLLNGMSEGQRKHMNKKIEDYVKLFGELSGEVKR